MANRWMYLDFDERPVRTLQHNLRNKLRRLDDEDRNNSGINSSDGALNNYVETARSQILNQMAKAELLRQRHSGTRLRDARFMSPRARASVLSLTAALRDHAYRPGGIGYQSAKRNWDAKRRSNMPLAAWLQQARKRVRRE